LILADWLTARSLSELLDGWRPQRFLAERTITIVTYFGLQGVKFISCGRNSGQRRNEEDVLHYTMPNTMLINNGRQEPESKILIG
jgi:hypothetical protein